MTNPPTPAPTDSVSGTVTFKGSPLPGATVTAWIPNTNSIYQTATTDASGNYSFSGLQTTGDVPMDLHFWVTKPGYGFYPSVGSGARVTRADHTGEFVQTGALIYPLYMTVIDYTALPDASLAGADFAAYDGSNPVVKLAATGQTASYASGDDGARQSGVAWAAQRFTNNGDGTVTDGVTGLIWLKNADCFSPALWADALTDVNQLASGACGLTDGSNAGQWRLPNMIELESVVDVSASNPALSAGHPFINVVSGLYWTSTSYFGGEEGSPYAWVIHLGDGSFVNDRVNNIKLSSYNRVWAVKGSGGGAVQLQATGLFNAFHTGDDGSLQTGVPLIYPRFIDNGNGTVTDSVTGLIWLKQANCIQQSWDAALAAVQSLASGQCGLTDGSAAGSWRMPNRNEMQSLADRNQNNEADYFDTTFFNSDNSVYQAAVFTSFVSTQYYWTSTTDAADTSEAWAVFSCDYGVYGTPKSDTGYTLAVR
jgi:hypothetical protein